jgi:4-diphosphocytidyl-2-C-methyl-D-erythritol kinase
VFPIFLWDNRTDSVAALSIFAPAKLNLFLAVTGRRADGFHDLVSLVAPLDLGDTLHAEAAPSFSLTCDDPALACDDSNLVLKAAAISAAAAGKPAIGGAKFFLEKRIPVSAGLGGGSSDGVAALKAMAQLAGGRIAPAALPELAAQLGSDCPLFLYDRPVVLRGRGERVAPVPAPALARLRGRRVVVFKPGFGVATAWAYGQLAAAADQAGTYLRETDAEGRLSRWIADEVAPAEELLFNTMEPPVFAKFLALPTLLEQLQRDFGLAARMSGSGSSCFAFLRNDTPVTAVFAAIRAAWGESAFVIEARLT